MKIINKTTGETYEATLFNGEHPLVTAELDGTYQIAMRGTSFEIAKGVLILENEAGEISLQHPSAMADYETVAE